MKKLIYIFLTASVLCLISCHHPTPEPDVKYTVLNPPILVCYGAKNTPCTVQPMDSAIKISGYIKDVDSLDVNQDGIYDLKFSTELSSSTLYIKYFVESLHENCYYCRGKFRDTISVDNEKWLYWYSDIGLHDEGGLHYIIFKIIDKDGPHVGWIGHSLLPPSGKIWYIESVAYSTLPYHEFVVGEKK